MQDEETIEILKKRLAESKKITANQQETIKYILNGNKQMIKNNKYR